MDSISFQPIGIVHSCFKEKFGIPRQPGLAPQARAELELFSPYNRPEAFTGLEQCSHIWLQFVFHGIAREQWKPTVRPPRFGGNQRMGVFATRSTHRPNPIGLSVVKLDAIEGRESGEVRLRLSGVDLLDGTPVLDIKPYIPYVDAVVDAHCEFADTQPECLPVCWSGQTLAAAESYESETGLPLIDLVEQVLQQDPRPAYQTPDTERVYGMRLYDLNIQWRYSMNKVWEIHVINIENFTD